MFGGACPMRKINCTALLNCLREWSETALESCHMNSCVHACMRACMHVCVCVYECAHMHVCSHACMRAFVCMWTNENVLVILVVKFSKSLSCLAFNSAIDQ